MKRIVLSVCAAVAAAVSAWGGTATWQPDGDGNWAGDWKSTEHWSTGAEPTSADDVVLPTEGATASYTVTAGAKINAKSLTVGSGAGNGFTATFESQTWDMHEIAGNLVVKGDGKMTHSANTTTSDTPAENTLFKLRFSVGSNATIEDGAVIEANGKGFPAGYHGPGKGVSTSYSGSHGGRPQPRASATPAACYDSIETPVMLGSSGSSAGGGAIWLDVTGNIVLNGTMTVNGYSTSFYSGAGGSVCLFAAAISGTGTVEANGGPTTEKSYGRLGGGGGRIAIKVAEGGFAAWQGHTHAYGGTCPTLVQGGGAGTVYLKEGTRQGIVRVDNNSISSSGGTYGADWPSGGYDEAEFLRSVKLVITNGGAAVVGANTLVGDVHIEKGGILNVSANRTLSIYGSFSNSGNLIQPATALVTLVGPSEATVSGKSTFANFSCTEPGKTIRFATGEDNLFGIAASGSLTLRGAGGNLLALRGTTAGSAWKMNVGSAAVADLEYLDVEWSDASGGEMVAAKNSLGGAPEKHNEGWKFPREPIPGETNTWLGVAVSWQNPANWSLDRLPVATDAIRVPGGTANSPGMEADGAFERLIVDEGATFSLKGFDLSVSNSLEVAGVLASTGGETLTVGGDISLSPTNDLAKAILVLVGDAAQAVSPAGLSFDTINVLKTGGRIAFDDGFSAMRLIFEPSAALSVTFAESKTVTAERLVLNGASGGLELTSSGTATWKLNATVLHDVVGVTVAKSCATGAKIYAAISTDVGGNENWVFNEASSRWTGAVSQDFREPGNWWPVGVPGPTSRVVIASQPGVAATISLAAGEPVSIRELSLFSVDGATAVLTSKARMTVGGGVLVGSGGMLALDYCGADGLNVVSNDFVIADGGVLTHSGNGGKLTVATSRVCLEVLGDMRIQSGGEINVDKCGFDSSGPGSGHWIGGTHGGHGGAFSSQLKTSYLSTYGSVECPVTVGEAGRSYSGGGAVRLKVGQTLYLQGSITALGTGGNYGSAGGSVWITAKSLSGDGLIDACGGDVVSYTMGGGGGRISIAVEQGGFANWCGRTLAFGGRRTDIANQAPGGFAGTICMREGNGLPYVLVDNDGGHVVVGGWNHPIGALWPTEDTEEFLRSAQLTIRNGGHVTISEDTCVGEISLEDGGYLTVTNVTLKINSTVHRKRRKWTGTVQDSNGQIIWPSGMLLIVK